MDEVQVIIENEIYITNLNWIFSLNVYTVNGITYVQIDMNNEYFLFSRKNQFMESFNVKSKMFGFKPDVKNDIETWIENTVFKIELRKQKIEKILSNIHEKI